MPHEPLHRQLATPNSRPINSHEKLAIVLLHTLCAVENKYYNFTVPCFAEISLCVSRVFRNSCSKQVLNSAVVALIG